MQKLPWKGQYNDVFSFAMEITEITIFLEIANGIHRFITSVRSYFFLLKLQAMEANIKQWSNETLTMTSTKKQWSDEAFNAGKEIEAMKH